MGSASSAPSPRPAFILDRRYAMSSNPSSITTASLCPSDSPSGSRASCSGLGDPPDGPALSSSPSAVVFPLGFMGTMFALDWSLAQLGA